MYKFSEICYLIILGCLCLLFASCKYTPYRYNYSLVESGNESLNFEDSNVQFRFLPSPEKIRVAVRNKTDHEINLIRDKAEFLDHLGESYPVLYGYNDSDFEDEMLSFADNNRYIPPMKIDPSSEVTGYIWINTYLDIELMRGRDRVRISDIRYSMLPFFPRSRSDGSAEELKGSTFHLILPVDFDGSISEYMFTFVINDVIEEKEIHP